MHFTPPHYRDLAEQSGFHIIAIRVTDKAWDFRTREGFRAFGHATFVEWTRHLPEGEIPAFIDDVLDRYRSVAADSPQEENTFKFYQMEAVLTPRAGVGTAAAP